MDFIWLELLATTGNRSLDERNVGIFQRRLRQYGLNEHFCLLLLPGESVEKPELRNARFYGIRRRELEARLRGPNTLLNLSWSIRDPLVEQFERRIFCSLDPSEICFWMPYLEMGQSFHQEFWTIGLAINEPNIRLTQVAPLVVRWKTFYPLVDTHILKPVPRPPLDRFTTVGQWYWQNLIEIEGRQLDFSKKETLAKFFGLPKRVPDARFELAVWLNAGDSEAARIRNAGWHRPPPERVAGTPERYYNYLRYSLAEFTFVKLDRYMQSGWLSDRAAAYLALGRPVVTEPTNAENYLPRESGFLFVHDIDQAVEAVRRVRKDWTVLSTAARECAVEYFDAATNLRRILKG